MGFFPLGLLFVVVVACVWFVGFDVVCVWFVDFVCLYHHTSLFLFFVVTVCFCFVFFLLLVINDSVIHHELLLFMN